MCYTDLEKKEERGVKPALLRLISTVYARVDSLTFFERFTGMQNSIRQVLTRYFTWGAMCGYEGYSGYFSEKK